MRTLSPKRLRRLIGATGLIAALTLGLATWPWSNEDGDAPAAQAQETDGTTDGVAPSEAEAAAEAAASGEPVEVLALRSEQRDVWAQPDGSFVAHEYASPVRTWVGGAWVDIDTTLEVAEDGSIGPVAATVRMRFSAGGEEPMVTVSKNGHEMTLDWPGALPTPTLEGDTAVYAEVLPGVDLRVTARATGFTHTLVVKNADAAQQPELASIEWPVTLDGSAVETTPEGGLDVVDAGTLDAWLSAQAPVMWDSSGVDEAAEAIPSVGAMDLSDPAVAQEVARQFGEQVPVEVSGDGDVIVLTPDQGLLSGPDTVYPVYIDPEYEDELRTAWAMVASYYSTTEYWKWTGSQGVGYCNGPGFSNCVKKRQFFRMPTSAYRGKDILSAEFAVTVAYNWYHDNHATGYSVYLDRARSGISSGTNWSNQPTSDHVATAAAPAASGGKCSTPSEDSSFAMEWNVKPEIQDAANDRDSTVTFRVRGNESNVEHWIRICNNAHLRVHYNTPPDQPDTGDMYSRPGPACAYTISADSYVNEWPVLHARGTDPDRDQVRMRFRLVWGANDANQWYSPWSSYKASGSEFTLDLATASGVPDLPAGEPIGWIAQVSDGEAVSSWSWAGAPARCRFTYDATAPDPPTVSSSDFPTGTDGEPAPIVPMVGQIGQLTLSTTDDDLAAYKIDFTDDDEGPREVALETLGADAVVEYLPTEPGFQVATVVAVDAAGNSASDSYSFRVSASDPVGVWALGDAAGADQAADLDGSNPGTPGAGVTFGADGPGNMTAAAFDGTDGAYIDTSVYNLAPTGQGVAIAAWARVDDLSRDGVIASIDGGIGEAGMVLGYRSTSATSGAWVLSMPDMPAGAFTAWEAVGGLVSASNQDEWVHLVGVWNDYTGQMTLYLNGAEVASAQRESTWWGDGTVQIGRATVGGFWDDQFSGRIADVRVFDRVVPPAEAEELGWQTAIRQGLWQFNTVGNTGSPEFDGGPEAVLTGGASIFTGSDDPLNPQYPLIGDGHLELDGVDGAAVVGDPVADTARSFSISARVRLDTDAASGPMTVFSIPGTNATAMEVVYAPDCDGEGNACWRLRVAESDAADANLISVDGSLDPSDASEGQELTVVFDATTGQARLYVNGAAAVAGDDDLLLTSWSATGDFTVGHSDTGGYFAGAIDDVRVYTGVLHPSVIGQLAVPPLRDRPEI